jgi:hypothetical protein
MIESYHPSTLDAALGSGLSWSTWACSSSVEQPQVLSSLAFWCFSLKCNLRAMSDAYFFSQKGH